MGRFSSSNGESSSPGFFFLQFCDRCQKNLVKFSKKLANFAEFTLDKKNNSQCVLSKINNKSYPPNKIRGTPHPSLNVCFGSVVSLIRGFEFSEYSKGMFQSFKTLSSVIKHLEKFLRTCLHRTPNVHKDRS